VAVGLDDLADRFGVGATELEGYRWIERGGRGWLHRVDAWPLEAWEPGSWRAVSLGVRAMELDGRGRARPTNDVLRILDTGIRRGAFDVTLDELRTLLARGAISAEGARPGPGALRWSGTVIGRGTVGADGLTSEIPKARAADLSRVLEQGAAPAEGS